MSAIATDAEPSAVVRAAKVVEQVVGNAWATDAGGRFVYVTPSVLDLLGVAQDDLNPPSDDPAAGWERLTHPDDYPDAAAAWRRCLRTGEHYHVAHRLRDADGSYRWSRCSGQPVRDTRGRILGWYGTVLERSAAPGAAEPAAVRADRDDPAGDTPSALTLVHPDDRSGALHGITHAFWTGRPQPAVLRLREPEGDFHWAEVTLEPPRYDPDGRLRWKGDSVVVDPPESGPAPSPFGTRALTASFDTEAEAARAIQVIEGLFGNAWAIDPLGKVTYLTAFSQVNIDQTIGDVNAAADAGHTVWKPHTHPDDYDGLAAAWRHCLATGDKFFYEHRVKLAYGYAWNRSVAQPIRDRQGRIAGWCGTSITTDVYKKNEEALRAREQELSQLVDLVPSHVWRLTPAGEPAFFNKRMADYLGRGGSDGEVAGGLEGLIAAVHPDDRQAFREGLGDSLATGEPFSLRYRLRRHDGAYHWMSSRAEPLFDAAGAIIQWFGVCHDVDELTTAHQALREREKFLWQLVETLPAMIDCAAPDGEPVYRSQQLREFLGYPLEVLDEGRGSRLVQTLDAGVHPDDLAGVKADYDHALRTGEPYARRHRLRRFDGAYRWVETRAAPMRDAHGAIVQWNVICLDIDGEMRAQEDLRLAQERLARASQAASLAELSASIAHEVNQPLAAVVLNSQACQRWLTASPPNLERAQTTIERIIRDANAAADVVSRIRALFSQAAGPRTHASIGDLIADVGRLIADRASRTRVEMTADVAEDLPTLLFDVVQIQQVLANLIRNAIDALEDGAADRPRLAVRAFRKGGMVQVEVSDNGPGVPETEKVFDAFFTTKPSGMGMGLAICRSIVESHGGRLWVEPKAASGGATFAFTLPIEATAPS
jgi:PAS domain S-box-containing protein